LIFDEVTSQNKLALFMAHGVELAIFACFCVRVALCGPCNCYKRFLMFFIS